MTKTARPPVIMATLRQRIVRELQTATRRKKGGGLSAPEMYAAFAAWRDDFARLSLDERFTLAALLLSSHVEEQGHAALAVLRGGLADVRPQHFPRIDQLLDDFTSWSQTDDFASGKGSITWYLLQRYPAETLALLEAWNRSQNMWKRRASVITFTRATAATGDYVDVTLRLCGALRNDPEDLVQKAVGWALKDTMRAGPAAKRRVIAFVKRMRREGVPSTITLYAVRDLKGAERASVLSVKARSG